MGRLKFWQRKPVPKYRSTWIWGLLSILLTLSFSSWAEIRVTDDLGNEVVLEKPASRIVALAPHLVEIVYAAGSGDHLVGVVSYSDFPEEASELPEVGSYRSFSAEAILRLQPDLILAWGSGNGVDRIAPLRALGLPVYVSEIRSLEGIANAVRRVGQLTAGTEADASAEAFTAGLEDLRRTYDGAEPLSVFYEVWNQPLQTVNGEHLISDVIRMCGGKNIFADAAGIAPKVSVESVLRRDPQVIVASGMAEERPDWLDDWRRWPQMSAVANQQLLFIPPDIIQRHTPRILQGAEQLCQQLQRARQHYDGHRGGE